MYVHLVNEKSLEVFSIFQKFLMKLKHNLVYAYMFFIVTMPMNICLTNFSN